MVSVQHFFTLMKYQKICKFGGEGGVWRGFVKLTLLVILCAERSIKNCPLWIFFSSVYAILNVSMSHTLICFYGYMLFVRLTTCVLGLKKDNSFNLVLKIQPFGQIWHFVQSFYIQYTGFKNCCRVIDLHLHEHLS